MSKVIQYVPPHHDIVDDKFRARFPNLTLERVDTVEQLAAALPTCDALITGNPGYSAEVGRAVRDHGKKLKWIQFTSVGIDTAAANGIPTGIPITNARGVRTSLIAGHAITLMMGLLRGFHHLDRYRRVHHWAREDLSPVIRTAENKTLVIVGLGDIGRDCARKAKAFDMRIIGVSRDSKPEGPIDEVFPRTKLHEVLPRADVLLLALPLEADTRQIIGAREIALLKPTAMIVNIARGALIDEAALARALAEKRIAGAAMDVFETEPLPADSPLWDLENVLFSPHVAGHSDASAKDALAELIADNLRRFAAGEPLRNLMRLG